jgi:flagellar biosynthetic protein FliR
VTLFTFFLPLLLRVFLSTARFGMFAVISPIPARDAPVKMRAALVVVLALFAATMDERSLPVTDLSLAVVPYVIGEILVGGVIGFTVRVVLSASDVLGGLLAQAMGLSFAQVYDPGRSETTDPLSRITTLLASAVAVALGAHRIALAYLLESIRVLPPGVAIDGTGAIEPLVATLTQAFEAGVRLGLPALAISVVTQLAVAFVSRAAPSLQVFSVGMTITAGAVLAVLITGLPDMVVGLEGRAADIDARIAHTATVLAR